MRQHPYQHQFADDVDLDEIFIGREQQLDQFNTALRRWKPLAMSPSPLRLSLPPSPHNRIQGLVILLHGRGGFGKTTLLKQYHHLALEEASWLQSSAIVDWEFAVGGKRTLFNLALDEEVDVMRYFTLLHDQLAIALNKSIHDFKEYLTSMKVAEEAIRQANKILDRLPSGEHYSWARTITRETLLALISSLPGLSGLNTVLSDNDLGQKIRGFVDAGFNIGAEQIKEQLQGVRDFVYEKLDRRLATYLEPTKPLSQALGHDLATFAKKRPLLVFFDTYEEIDEGDPLLRYVMAAAGARIGWVLSGRDNLWAGLSHRYRNAAADYGYRDLVPPDRRFEVNFSADGVGDFALSDIQEYFTQLYRLCEKVHHQPPLPTISEKDAAHLLDVTQGVPLAVKIAATLYLETPDIKHITSGGEEKYEIVDRMVERYLLHTRTNPEDKARLYGLALLRRREEHREGMASLSSAKKQKEAEEPRAIAAALDLSPSVSYRGELIRLHRRYGFVFSQRGEPALHQEVRHFLRLWLLEHRMDPEITRVNQRLKEAHVTAFQELETHRQYPHLRARFNDEQWVKIYLDLTEQCFWLDPAQGVQSLLPFMLAAGVYCREANRDAVIIGNFFKPVLIEPYRSRWQWAADSLWHTDSRNPLDDELRGLEALIKLMRQSPFTFPALLSDFHKELEAALWWRFGDAHQGRDEVKAREWWRKAHNRLPQEAELRRVLAEGAENGHGPEPTVEERAIDDFTLAIETDPTNAALYAHRGEAYLNENEYQLAITDLEHALQLGSTEVSIYYHLGKAYLYLNENEQAIAYFNQALEQDATATECYAERGIAYKNLGEYQQAIADLEHALQLDSSQALTYYHVGKVYMDLNEHRKAITYFTHALERDTKSAQLYTDRGIAHKHLGEYEQALLDFDIALQLDLKLPQALAYRGEIYLHLSKHQSSGADKKVSLAPISSASSSSTSQPPSSHSSSSSTIMKGRRLSRRTVIAGTAALGLVAVGGGLYLWRLFPLTPSRLLYIYHGHLDTVTSVAWSPDGMRIASGSYDHTVQIWDAANGGHVYTYRGHNKRVICVAWSPDGIRIASGSDDSTLQIWDAANGKYIFTYQDYAGPNDLSWSPNGARIASGRSDHLVQSWNALDGSDIVNYRGYPSYLWCTAWSPDGVHIAAGGSDSTVHVWNAQNGNHLVTYEGHSSKVYSVSWSPDGTRIASGSDDSTVQVWQAQDGNNLLTYRDHSGSVNTVAWSPDSTRIASGGADHTVQVWQAQDGNNLLTYRGHSSGVYTVAWSPDSTRIASGSIDHTVQVWQAPSPRLPNNLLYIYYGHTATVRSVSWSPDSQRIASASEDMTVQIWDAANGRHGYIYRGHNAFVTCVAWSPDGTRIALASVDHTVQVWDAANGGHVHTYRGHTDQVQSIAWSPDGTRIASGGDDHTVQVRDAKNGNLLVTYSLHSDAIMCVAWSPDNTRIASASNDHTMQVWDAQNGNSLVTCTGSDAMQSVTWSPDGTHIASGNRDRTVRVWRAQNGSLLFIYRGHTDVITVRAVAWSPDGTRIASGSVDQTVQVWKPA